MHEIFTQVLTHKDLPKAGDLFAIPDQIIINDLTAVIHKIRDIAGLPDYTRNDNDQSVVEICITRVTSAIRETGSIEQHAEALVLLLQTCLSHNLRPTNRGQDPPHAKIASDVLSCIFLNYNKREVIALALPVAVKFLHKGNKELSRNMCSYLSLSAIEAADLLAKHVQPIIDSVISGNYGLSRVLLQIYAVEKEPIHDHLMTLVSLLPQCDVTDKLGLLTLFSLVARNKPALLEPSLSQLVDCLSVGSTALATLQIFIELCLRHSASFAEHITKLKAVGEQQPHCLAPALIVLAFIGKISKEKAKYSLDYIAQQLPKVGTNQLTDVLREVQSLCTQYPALLNESLMTAVLKCNDRATTSARECVQQLLNEYNEIRNTNVNHTPGGVTIVRVGGRPDTSGATSRSELNLGHRDVSLFQQNVSSATSSKFGNKYQRHLEKHIDSSRSTGRLISSSNRSMPRLNALPQSTTRLGSSSIQLNKSLTLLNSSHGLPNSSHVIPNSSSHMLPNSSHILPMNRSATVLSNSNRPLSTHVLPSHSSLIGPFFSASRIAGGAGASLSNAPSSSASTIANSSSAISALPGGGANNSYPNATSIGQPHPAYHNLLPSLIVSSSSSLTSPTNSVCSTAVVSSSPSVCSISTASTVMTLPSSSLRTRQISSDQTQATKTAAPRISVFEPYAMRDTVQHFCEKHLDKIKAFMLKVFVKLPLPVRCGIEERKNRKHAKLYFSCQGKGDHCLYNKQFFNMKTRNPRIWIHLMFLALQARSSVALSTRETQVSSLKNCWDILKCDEQTFITLVTSAFPSAKDVDLLLQELRLERFFDVFEYNGLEQQWRCFLCNHPDRAQGFVEDSTPVMEGQLKEKKNKWKIFKRWRTKYFTLSGAHFSYRNEEDKSDSKGGIEVQQIRSVKVSRSCRHIPKAFEIFTDKKSFVLKARDSSNAEEWIRCLSIVVAHCQAKERTHHGNNPSHLHAATSSVPRNFHYAQTVFQSHSNHIMGSKTHL